MAWFSSILPSLLTRVIANDENAPLRIDVGIAKLGLFRLDNLSFLNTVTQKFPIFLFFLENNNYTTCFVMLYY